MKLQFFLYVIILGLVINLLANMIWKYIPGTHRHIDKIVSAVLIGVCIILLAFYQEDRKTDAPQQKIEIRAPNIGGPQIIAPHSNVTVAGAKPSESHLRQLILECERLAASPYDLRRPQGVSGVEFRGLQKAPDAAVNACTNALSQDSNNPRLLSNKARALSAAGRNQEAFSLLRRAADMREPIAMTNLAGMYVDGTAPLGKDEPAGVDLYRRAADLGAPFADYVLGQAAEFGWCGLPKDTKEAVKRYKVATKYEIPKAHFALGLAHISGVGVSPDKSIGIELVARSAELGHTDAARYFAAYIADGAMEGVSSDRAVNIVRNLVPQQSSLDKFSAIGCPYGKAPIEENEDGQIHG